MTQEEKKLLLKDLYARLPYGVIVKYKSQESEGQIKLGYGNIGYVAELGRGWWIDCKPYLRPMSSMTEEEKKEYGKVCELDTEILANHPMNGEPFPALYNSQDWLNAHHFDYRGLIKLGLALEAPEGMYER